MISRGLRSKYLSIVTSRRLISTTNGQKIGFIGLGNMGSRMAPHLVNKSNSNLFVFDMNEKTVTTLVEQHQDGRVKGCSSPNDVFEQSDVVITMLPGPNQVESVYKSAVNKIRDGQLLIDASTIDPGTSKRVNELILKSHQIDMVDAPVSGGVGGASGATLTFMVGGKKQAFERAQPILQLMGKNVIYCGGEVGDGQSVKICNNLVLAISMSAVSEAMVLGTRLGIDPKVLAQVFNTSSGRCWSSDTYNPHPGVMDNVPSSRNYEGGFAANLMLKDVGLAIKAAESAKMDLPLGELVSKFYTEMRDEHDMGNKDFSGVLEYFKIKADTK
ncbi:3-hydroxyisobutyrate dehydrogenase [Acrasis kona]|uniref:3-hydroxyisobutyrate dehydrogenase n=1 Tax=Acrasis kona TaxID=1008807 RepID=A0AAW2YYU9_9EUKA